MMVMVITTAAAALAAPLTTLVGDSPTSTDVATRGPDTRSDTVDDTPPDTLEPT